MPCFLHDFKWATSEKPALADADADHTQSNYIDMITSSVTYLWPPISFSLHHLQLWWFIFFGLTIVTTNHRASYILNLKAVLEYQLICNSSPNAKLWCWPSPMTMATSNRWIWRLTWLIRPPQCRERPIRSTKSTLLTRPAGQPTRHWHIPYKKANKTNIRLNQCIFC